MKKWLLAVFVAMLAVPMSAAAGLPDFDTDLKAFRAKMSKMEVPPVPEEAQLPRTVDAFGPNPEKTLRDIVQRLAEHAGLGDIGSRVFIDMAHDGAAFDCQIHSLSLKGGPDSATIYYCPDDYYLVFGNGIFLIRHSTDELAASVAHELSHAATRNARHTLSPRQQEDMADAESLDLLRLAGFDPVAATMKCMHSKEYWDALQVQEYEDGHDLLLNRAQKMKVYNLRWPGTSP